MKPRPLRLTNLLLIPLLLAGLLSPGTRAAALAAPLESSFSPSARQVLSVLAADQKSGFIITLRDQLAPGGAGTQSAGPLAALLAAAAAQPTKTARQTAVIEGLQAQAAGQQAGLLAQASLLQAQGQVSGVIPFWIFNGVSLQATPAAIRALAARPEVARVTPDPDPAAVIVPLGGGTMASSPGMNAAPSPLTALTSLAGTTTSPEPNVALVNAPALWAKGYTGQGVVIASLDTGVNAAHPDLAGSYRGGSNSWYDPYGQNAAPADLTANQHGTMTMGLMVGGSAGGTAIGMAPGAKWISAKIFDNSGNATNTAIHQAFQWVLNPNNNPAAPGAADVVNNSWGFTSVGCDTTFQPDVQALLAAGILPIFAAGNAGSGSQPTSVSPANNAGAFSVGSIDNNGVIASTSSRGPNACNAATPFPDLVAPGVVLKSSSDANLYSTCTGTSCSAPEVSGALALLLSALPRLGVDLQQQALIHGAVDLGPAGYDPTFGYGRLDALNAYTWLTGPLVVPTNLAASAWPSQIDLTWQDNNAANASGYEVDRSPDGLGGWVRLTTTPSGAASFSDSSGLAEGSTYTYRVRAVNAGLGTASQYASLQATTRLRTPTGLSAAALAPALVNLSWQNNTNLATRVEIQRSLDGLSGWTTIATAAPTATTYLDNTGLAEDTLYYYQLRAANSSTASAYTQAHTTTQLLAPAGLAASAISPGQINLSWTGGSSHATGYEIIRSPDGTSGWVSLTTTGPTAASYLDSGLAEAHTYYYQVRAVGAGVNSVYASANATTPLAAPTGVSAAAVSPGQIDLGWSNASAFETGTEVQRSPDGLTGWTSLATTGAAATTFSDNLGLTEGSTYFYRLRAVNPRLSSQYIGAAATTWLAAITGFFAVSASSTQINLVWKNNSTRATGIEIQRSPDGLSGWITLTTAPPGATSYPDTPLTPGTVYYYRARAVALVSTSAYTPVAHAFPAVYSIFLANIQK